MRVGGCGTPTRQWIDRITQGQFRNEEFNLHVPACVILISASLLEFLSLAHAQEQVVVGRPAAQGRLSLTVEKGLLSISIADYPLRTVLEELGSRIQVAFVTAERVADDSVSAELRGVSLDECVRQLLSGYDTFLYYGNVGGAASALRAVWVYPKGAASTLRPVPPDAWASRKELESMLDDPNPEVRERVYEALISRPDRQSQEMVLQAVRGIRESDEGLRQRILSAILSKGVPVPPELLATLVRNDVSEQIRWMALNALAEHPIAQQVAEMAFRDPSQSVRERAQEISAQFSSPRKIQVPSEPDGQP